MPELLEMTKFVKIKGGKKPSNHLSISKCGWVTIMDGLTKELHTERYRSVDFFSKDDGTVAVVFYKSKKEGELCLRQRAYKPIPKSCGFAIFRFVENNPQFIGYYKLEKTIQDEALTAFFKPLGEI